MGIVKRQLPVAIAILQMFTLIFDFCDVTHTLYLDRHPPISKCATYVVMKNDGTKQVKLFDLL